MDTDPATGATNSTAAVGAAEGSLATRIVLDLEPGQGVDTFEAWAERVSYIAVSTLIDETHRPHFTVHVEIVLLEDMNVSITVLSHPQLQVRSEEQIAQTGLDHILVWFYERGGVEGRFHRNHVKVEAGDIVLVDMAKPFETSIASSTILALMLPRARLPVALRNRDLHGILLNREIEATRLLAAHIRAFVRASRGLTVRQGLLAAEALVCLVQGALTPGGIMAETAETADATLLGRVQIHVEANLHKPELSVTEIAQALGMSRSTLYRLFEPMGGAAAYIRERRLLRAYEIIHSDLNPDLTLTSISFAQGFASEAYFSRAFKQRFGISPRAARKGAQNRRRAGDSIPPPPLTPGVQPLSFTAGKG